MNRKQRKKRLKRLNAARKAQRNTPITSGFKYKVFWATDDELKQMLDELYLIFTWESDKPKIRQRIDHIEAEQKRRRLAANAFSSRTKRWTKGVRTRRG